MNQNPSSRSGVSLVELMVSILLLMIAFLGWMRMNNIQAVRKESLRYAAVEKAAGLLDAMMSQEKVEGLTKSEKYNYQWTEGGLVKIKPNVIAPLWRDGEGATDDVPGYRIVLEDRSGASSSRSTFWNRGVWARMELFDSCRSGGNNPPFACLRVFLKGR